MHTDEKRDKVVIMWSKSRARGRCGILVEWCIETYPSGKPFVDIFMTSEQKSSSFDPLAFAHAWADLMREAQPVFHQFWARAGGQEADLHLDPLQLGRASAELMAHYARHPSRMVELQMQYWADMAALWHSSTQKFMGEQAHFGGAHTKDPIDRRFRDAMWRDHAGFDFLRQAYLLTRQAATDAVKNARELSPDDRQKLEFYNRLILDAMSPGNNPATNPEVIRETMRTGGENLLKGFRNLIDDMKRGDGTLKISTTQYNAFRPGKNLAVTPGKVVFQNRMMEVIQYAPSTKTVRAVPLVILPPWINKYYILDLRPENSFVKYAVDQGFTVFMVSWKNPDRSFADVTFDDYLMGGFLAVLDVAEGVTGAKSTNVVGYCIGGTLLNMGLSYLAAKKQSSRVKSATCLTTLLDFHRAGDMKVFIDESQLQAIEHRMNRQGFLDSGVLQKTFSILRANDLIWSFVVNNYFLGREPFPFDILYWNDDSTHLPAAFHSSYLRNLYLKNLLVKPGAFVVAGVPVDLTSIKTPMYFLSTRDDHIAPWGATFDGARLIAHKNKHVRFVLAASGHVAGVVNPPVAKKYNYWVGGPPVGPTDEWLHAAKSHDGSWWVDWAAWVHERAGAMVAPPKMGCTKFKPVADAPGTYVLG